MPQRLIALVTSALLIGGLFIGAPVRVQAVTDTVYVADVASAGAGGSCSAPDYATGVLDDDVAIQAAIDEVDDSPSLTTVYLCAGTYNITATLEPTEDITFIGAGAATTILDGGANYDGDVYVDGGVSILFSFDSVTVEGLTFQHGANVLSYDAEDYATWGGGAINSLAVTVIDSTFTHNEATFFGGAIWTYGPSTIQGNNVFTGNTAYLGGAIYNYSGEDLTIQGSSLFTGNTAYQGGAIFSWGHTRVTNGTFSNNESECDGGAISAENDVTVTSSTFTGNITNCSGGAIEANNLSVTASTFKGNEANHIGGAVRADATATVTNSAFTSNSASWEGGAILAATGTVDGSRFTRNTSGRNGGAIYFYSPAPTDLRLMRRNTFSRNRAAAGGALTLGPCGTPSRSQAARVQRANRFSGNRATEQRRTNNIERLEGGCG